MLRMFLYYLKRLKDNGPTQNEHSRFAVHFAGDAFGVNKLEIFVSKGLLREYFNSKKL